MNRLQKSFSKILSIFLITAILLENLIQIPLVSAAEPKEEISLREEYSKTYIVGSTGNFTLYNKVLFSSKVHYQKDGKWEEVENRFVETNIDKYTYKNKANEFDFFVGEGSEDGVIYKNGKVECKIIPLTIDNQPIQDSNLEVGANTANYQISSNIRLAYTLMPDGVKTEFVVKESTDIPKEILLDITNCDPEIFDTSVMLDKNEVAEVEQEIIYSTDSKQLLLKPQYETFEAIEGEVRIDPSISIGVEKDTFVSPSTPYGNGTRRFIAIGTYYDSTVDALFKNSVGLIKFGKANLPENANVEDLSLELYHYGTNTNNDALFISTIENDWTEDESSPGPNIDGNYGQTTFPYYNSNAVAELREIELNKNILNKLDQSYGIAISNVDANKPGVVVCSKEIPSGPCLTEMEPKLNILYSLGSIPKSPTLLSPEENWKLGPNESLSTVVCSQTGAGQGCNIQFKIQTEDVAESIPITTEIEIVNEKDERIQENIEQQSPGTFTKDILVTDGTWRWRARTKNKFGNTSDWSTEKHFTIDTTAPPAPEIINEPEFSKGSTNYIKIEKVDDISIPVKYFFESSTKENFSTGLKSSNYISTDYYTFTGLSNETSYYYHVRAKDNLGNISSFGKTIKSTQDTVGPTFGNISKTNNVISPANQDGNLDTTNLSFEARDLHWKANFVRIYNTQRNIVREYENLPQNVNLIIDGKDNNGTWLPDGIYKLEIVAHDLAGNITIIGGPTRNETIYTLVIDNTAGVLNISYPENGSWFNDNSKINGITGNKSVVEIRNITTNQTFSPVVDPEIGIFEQIVNLENGENNFQIFATDTYGNKVEKQISIFKDIESPTISQITPNGLSNDSSPIINLNLEDFGTGDFISGINAEKTYLSIFDRDSNEIVLVNEGLNVSDFGHIEQNCDTQGTYGSSKAKTCNYQYIFEKPLSPDGDYEVYTKVTDIAGNFTEKRQSFSIDTKTILEVNSPTDEQKFNYSKIEIAGVAEKGSEVKITVNNIERPPFQIEPGVAQEHSVTDCYTNGEGIELCKFEVSDFALFKDLNNDTDIANLIRVESIDPAGNIASLDKAVYVNLFAVNLSIDTDLEFFSPNADGKQDGVNFERIETDAQVESWQLEIRDRENILVKMFEGLESPPSNIYWEGKDENNEFVPNGDYSYTLKIETTDGLMFQTEWKQLYAKTSVDKGVVITSPKNNTVTTKGITNVYGIAENNSQIRICVDTIGLNGNCDFEYWTNSLENGTFSTVIPLIRLSEQNQTIHEISAWIIDKYGNQSEISNTVKITVDTIDPFISVSALPVITGVNKETDYQKLIDKIEAGEEIKKEDIDKLKTVILRSTVSENTEWVNFEYADFTNLSELPESVDYKQIGWIDGENNSHWFSTPLIRGDAGGLNCSNSQCTWDFYYPVPPVIGGIYEIVFTGKKSETVEKLSASIIIDGTLPLAPTILDINGSTGSPQVEVSKDLVLRNYKYYSNSKSVEIIGVSDPEVEIEIMDQNGNKLCLTETNEIGIFSCQTDLSSLYPNDAEVKIKVLANDGQNIVESINETILIIDQTKPAFVKIEADNQWTQSKTEREIHFEANETLLYALVQNSDVVLSNDAMSGTQEVFINTDDEGIYQIELKAVDLAGNESSRAYEFFVDNTIPDKPTIDTSTWGSSGINYKPGIPATSRLTEGFVTSDDELNISGLAELNTEVSILVNGISIDRISCPILAPENDTKENQLCNWNHEIAFEKEGGYTITVQSKDQAGNLSEFAESVTIYLDRTPPEEIKFLNLEDSTYENDISFSIETERLADLKIEVLNPSGEKASEIILQNSATGITNFKVNLGDEIGNYKIKVTAYDSAGNYTIAEKVVAKLEVQIPNVSDDYSLQTTNQSTVSEGEVLGTYEEQMIREKQENSNQIQGATLEDPWAGQIGNNLPNAWMDVRIRYDGSYEILKYSVPSPTLTMISESSIYGVATPKGKTIPVNYNFEYATFTEAKNLCGIPSWKVIGTFWGNDKKCVEEKMGISDLNKWYAWESGTCAATVFAQPICMSYKLNNLRTSKSGYAEVPAQNVMVSFYKNDGKDEVGHIWNDEANGNFNFGIKIPEMVNNGDKIKAKTSIFGDFEINGIKVDYRMGDGKGLQSWLSSPLTVGGASSNSSSSIPDFVDPLGSDPVCQGVHNASKQYTVAEAAILLGDMLTQRTTDKKYYSKFKCADHDSPHIPQKAKDMYTVAGNYWNPDASPNTYVQCIAFVYMAYSLADNPIRKVTGNAITMGGEQWNCSEFATDENGQKYCPSGNQYISANTVYKDQFEVYRSGETTDMPKPGDVMIWEPSYPNGHVGIVTYVSSHSVSVVNANSNKVTHEFDYKKENGKITIIGGSWKPFAWARKK